MTKLDISKLIHESTIQELSKLYERAGVPSESRSILIGLKKNEDNSVEYFMKDIEVVSEPSEEDAVTKYSHPDSDISFYIVDAHAGLLTDMVIEYKATQEGGYVPIFSKREE